MPIDTSVAGSPGWWMQRLATKLNGRRARLEMLDRYYRGDPPLPEGAANAKSAYQAFQKKARTNYAQLVVEAVRHRMILTGFRTGASNDENGDAAAARIMRINGLAVESAEVHRIMLTLGDAYVIVGKDENGEAIITAQDPRQVVTEHDPRRQRIVRAAFNEFRDEVEGADFRYVYLRGAPGENVRMFVARRDRPVGLTGVGSLSTSDWRWDLNLSAELPIDVVPVVRFRNDRGVGEFEDHLFHLDRINHMLLQRMTIATSQAFRQRMLIGNLPTQDDEGNEIDYEKILSADPGAVWQLPAGVVLQEAAATDLTPVLESVRHDVQDLAAVTSTPLQYVVPDSGNQSAEGASLARESLVFKTENRIERARDGWAQTMSLAFLLAGDKERSDPLTIDPMFAPAERYSLAERFDAGSKAPAAGVPWRTRMADVLQFSPDAIARMETERTDDALNALLLASASAALPSAAAQPAIASTATAQPATEPAATARTTQTAPAT